jgi:tetratricopeptide (TPR) repeat protein
MAAVMSMPFVGRKEHRAAYQQMLRGAGPWLLVITGQGGNGKSRLLRQLQAETPDGIQTGLLDFANEYLRTQVLQVAEEVADCLQPLADAASFQAFRQAVQDGRRRITQMQISISQEVRGEQAAHLQQISQSISVGGAVNELRKQVERLVTDALLDLARAARGRPVALLLDTCEWFHEPGSQDVGVWLKDTLPRLRQRLGGRLLVLAAGREGLERFFPFEDAAHQPLHLLPFPELDGFLQQLGMQEAALRRAVYEMTRGHPLCASIVAQVWRERPFGPADLPAFQGEFSDRAVTSWVLERVIQRLQPHFDDLTRYGVLLRSFDLPLLRAVFPEWLDSGDQVFQRLIGYSFIIRLANRRWAFHDLLRAVQADYVRRQLPDHWREYHQRALRFWEQQREEVFGRQMRSPDYYYHRLALDEEEATGEWESAAWDAAIIGEKDYWGRLLQAAHDSALAPGQPLRAARAFHQGRFFYYDAQWDQATAQFQQALTLFEQVGDRLGEATTRRAIGDVQQFRKDLDAALASYQQALTLFEQVGSRLGEATTRQAIGDVQRFRADYDAALASYQQALTLFEQVGSRLGEANTRQAIGDVQQFRKDLDAALASYQQALTLFEQVGDRLGEANTRRAIGDVQRFRDDYDAALASYQQALTLFEQVGDRLGEANTRRAIGDVQRFRADHDAALASYQQALTLFEQVGSRLGEATTRKAIGDVQRFRDDYDAALASYQQALTLFEQVGDRLGEANTRRAIGDVQQFRADYDAALASYQQALTLFEQVGDRLGEANCYTSLGLTASAQKQYSEALRFYARAEALYQAIEDNYSQTLLRYHRSFTHAAYNNRSAAIQDMEVAVQIAERLKLPQLGLFRQRLEELRGGAT